MADYSRQQQNAYDAVARKGGKIVFTKAPSSDVPADPEAPWEGNDDVGEPFEHVAILLPLDANKRTSVESNHRVIIPAKGLPFEVRTGLEFTDAVGRLFAITALGELAPDPAQLILYDCECALWPTTTD